MEQLDRLDRKILFELDLNSRLSISALARKLKLGRDIVDYRVSRMTRKGLITGFRTMINPVRLGQHMYKTYCKLDNKPDRRRQLIQSVRKMPSSYWIGECDGEWDLMIGSLVRTPYEFYQIQNRLMHRYNDLFLDFSTFNVVSTWIYAKSYLIGEGTNRYLFAGDVPTIDVDSIDYEILKILTMDARIHTQVIAQQLNLSSSAVTYRISRLERDGVIMKYRIDLDHPRHGMRLMKVHLFLRDYGTKAVNRLLDYCNQQPYVTYFIEQIGPCRLEIEYEVADYYQFVDFVEKLKEAFPDLISYVTTTAIRNEYHLNQLGTYRPVG